MVFAFHQLITEVSIRDVVLNFIVFQHTSVLVYVMFLAMLWRLFNILFLFDKY